VNIFTFLMDPWSRPHELSDDLESFFWVLMYEVVRHRNDQLRDLPEMIRKVFDQQSEPNKGMVWGGSEKRHCLVNFALSRDTIKYLVQAPCSAIIEKMRSLFHDLYLHEGHRRFSSQVRLRIEEARNQDPRVQCAHEKLRTSVAFNSWQSLKSIWDLNGTSTTTLAWS
jgi:hypothetical protein